MDRYVETQGLAFEVETEDTTLSTHTNKRIYYIPPKTDGTPGDIANVLFVSGTAVAGLFGNSVNQGTPVILIHGVYSFWSESISSGGVQRVSPASGLIVEKRGTVRP